MNDVPLLVESGQGGRAGLRDHRSWSRRPRELRLDRLVGRGLDRGGRRGPDGGAGDGRGAAGRRHPPARQQRRPGPPRGPGRDPLDRPRRPAPRPKAEARGSNCPTLSLGSWQCRISSSSPILLRPAISRGAIAELAARARAGRPVPDAPGHHRVRQVVHRSPGLIAEVQRPTLILAPNKSLAAQLAVRVPGVLPQEPGRVLRLVLRLLPARGVPALDGHLHREGLVDQRRDRPAPPLGHERAAQPART